MGTPHKLMAIVLWYLKPTHLDFSWVLMKCCKLWNQEWRYLLNINPCRIVFISEKDVVLQAVKILMVFAELIRIWVRVGVNPNPNRDNAEDSVFSTGKVNELHKKIPRVGWEVTCWHYADRSNGEAGGSRRLLPASDLPTRTTRRGLFSIYPVPLCAQTT